MNTLKARLEADYVIVIRIWFLPFKIYTLLECTDKNVDNKNIDRVLRVPIWKVMYCDDGVNKIRLRPDRVGEIRKDS